MKALLEKIMTKNGKIILACTACVLLVGVVCFAWSILTEQREVTVSIDGEKSSYVTFKHTVGEFLEDENIVIGKNDVVNVAMDQVLEDNNKINIQRAKEVNIDVDGNTLHLGVMDMTVGEALEQAGVTLDEDDTVKPSEDTKLSLGMEIKVYRIEVKEEVREMELAYPVEKRRDSSMSIYEEKVLREGTVGKQTDTYRVTYCNGKIKKEELLNSDVEEPIARVVVTGSYDVASRSGNQSTTATAKQSTSQATASSDSSNYAPNGMKYSTTLTVKATAYTHDGSKTKMGTECRVGAIAVDPSVIPLGTRLYVEGYGYCTAEDTGGKIKGNRIDVFLDTEAECNTWGVKTVKVYILD